MLKWGKLLKKSYIYIIYMNFLVETKNEYTIQLINILTPHLYEGFDSIYVESKKIIKKGEEKKLLKAFQQFIKRIPSWNSNLIENETKRIKNASRCDFMNNLLKAVIKANIILLSNNSTKYTNTTIDEEYLDIPLSKFIHKCYIECARQFYNAPYLFYHEIKPIERKRNQRDANEIIKQSIKEAIRKILPVQHILNQYLGNKINLGVDQIDKPISNADSDNLKQLLSQDLNYENKTNSNNSLFKSHISENIKIVQPIEDVQSEKHIKLVEPEIHLTTVNNDITKISYTDNDSDDETHRLISEMKLNMQQNLLIIDINNNNYINNDFGDDDIDDDDIVSHKSIPITQYYSTNKDIINNELKESERQINLQLKESEIQNNSQKESEIQNNSQKESEIQIKEDNEIKNIVIKKINYNDSESSMPYIGKDEEYEDVFSNILESHTSDILIDKINVNNNNKNDKKRKDIYFSRFNGL
jgi:hypothetical protein